MACNERKLSENDYQLYGIAFGCPYTDRMENCPLQELEELSFEEKYHWITELSEDQRRELVNHHINCSKNRV